MACNTTPRRLGKLRRNCWADIPVEAGIYWWYFPKRCITQFQMTDYCDTKNLHLRTSASGKVCLYVGIATSLRQRVAWHAAQPLRQSALRSGFLSTFRNTLLALNSIDYATGEDRINKFVDTLEIEWIETVDLDTAKQLEVSELIGDWHYPLNIQGNKQPLLQSYLRFLKQHRKSYRARMLH
ncbi:GIY-YIG nuclease family protein [Aeoliella sp. SH292]|uniref:GIY-YIG nuclease family protein n=1 Tax=Aeoliella sp. SH292 TaxID=3454464 RepID=UPI003F967D9E